MALHSAKINPGDFLILVVDDRAEQRYVRSRTLQREGYTVIETSSGTDALRLVQSRMPHLVLLDVKLPDIDGIEVCRRIKGGQAGSLVLVLHISAHMTSLQDRLRALDSGADGYLIQPVEMEEMVAVVRSLLRLHQAETALKEIALEWKASFDAISDGICLLDRNGAIVRHNRSLSRVLEQGGADLSGKRLADLIQIDPFTLASVDEPKTELARAGRWLELSVNSVHDGGAANIVGLVCVLADITNRKADEKALAHARNEAEAANRAKSTFLAAASHDLRQPLQAMGLFHDLLKKDIAGGIQSEYLRHIHEGMQSLDSMLSVLMDVSTLEAGTIKPNIHPCRVDDLLRRIADEHAGPAKAKDIRISARICDAFVETDLVLLERMVRNLVTNALRYTEKGRILISCRRRGDKVLIQVWDTGIGIEQANLDRIFDDYYQVNNGERDRSKGIGMGLSIVARMARLLSHRVEVHSRLGKGSVFTITADLSSRQIADPDEAPRNDSGIAGLQVAIVEDDPTQLHGLQVLLESWGCKVQGATSAGATEAAFDMRPDVIVTDYRLPGGISGLELGVRLRRSFGSDIPVILQTGDTDPELLKQAEQQSVMVLHKPYAPERLRELLGELALAEVR